MEPRIKYFETAPEGAAAMRGLESYVRHSGIEHSLLELVKMRALQINGCAYCLDMHVDRVSLCGGDLSAGDAAPFLIQR
ncbi:MAG TPA: carboxymuconolactone decarboxylase family protein [Candidatus Acidoferrales bacterium]|nr:carboxymuconolactone decarboxylase family protein [Candidatus Acidoferrales bacterium]